MGITKTASQESHKVKKAGVNKEDTPYMDELSKGPWPSHVKELKRTRFPVMMYEEAMREKYTQWGAWWNVQRTGIGLRGYCQKIKKA